MLRDRPRARRASSKARSAAAAAMGIALSLCAVHAVIPSATEIKAPSVQVPASAAARGDVRMRGGLRQVMLDGPPESLGAENARLQRGSMIAEENLLWDDFERYVPSWLARIGIADYSRIRYRHLADGVPAERRRELAAEAITFQPDPFGARMPTYQRMLFLHALYDVALPFEHSPLIGCTSFAFTSDEGHELVGRAFDFEADPVLDRDKTVYLVRPEGAIPFASVAWPGFVGVVTGMNAEGVVMVVHGARAGESRSDGVPVAFSLREALSHAHSTDEAAALLAAQRVMVSHIVFVVDGVGRVARVERAPGKPAYVARSQGAAWVTNHFEGPLADDPRNLHVRQTTTTLDRGDRVATLLKQVGSTIAPTEAGALAILRDHRCEHDPGCPLGDRRSIDALIATHGIVADATARVLWVSLGPHLSNRFVRFDLASLLAPGHDPAGDGEPDTLPPDPSVPSAAWSPVTSVP